MKQEPANTARARGEEGKSRKRRVWMSLLAVAAVSLAAFLLYRTLSRYSFDEILASVRAVPFARLAGAAGFAAASYLCLTGFDWLAVRYAGKPLPYRKTALASFVSLSLGHNIGLAALSSGAIRYRFYSRWGLSTGDVAKVILFCGATVALGLGTLGGVALLLRSDLAADITGLGRGDRACARRRLPRRHRGLSALVGVRAAAADLPALESRDAAFAARPRPGDGRAVEFRLRCSLPSPGARERRRHPVSRGRVGLRDRQRDAR